MPFVMTSLQLWLSIKTGDISLEVHHEDREHHSSHFLMVACIEVKLGTHAYYIISTTNMYLFPWRLHNEAYV